MTITSTNPISGSTVEEGAILSVSSTVPLQTIIYRREGYSDENVFISGSGGFQTGYTGSSASNIYAFRRSQGWDVSPFQIVLNDGATTTTLEYYVVEAGEYPVHMRPYGIGGSGMAKTINKLDDIGDVNASAPDDLDVVSWDAATQTWIPRPPTTPGLHTLDSHSDVIVTNPQVDETLVFNGAVWVNGAAAGVVGGTDDIANDSTVNGGAGTATDALNALAAADKDGTINVVTDGSTTYTDPDRIVVPTGMVKDFAGAPFLDITQLTVQDNSLTIPAASRVTTVIVPDGTLTDYGSGVVGITYGQGSGDGTVNVVTDGAATFTNPDRIVVPTGRVVNYLGDPLLDITQLTVQDQTLTIPASSRIETIIVPDGSYTEVAPGVVQLSFGVGGGDLYKDGSVPMDPGYAPALGQDIATKAYVDTVGSGITQEVIGTITVNGSGGISANAGATGIASVSIADATSVFITFDTAFADNNYYVYISDTTAGSVARIPSVFTKALGEVYVRFFDAAGVVVNPITTAFRFDIVCQDGPAGASGGGTGNVVGPVTSTLNALPRYANTSGDTIKDSPIQVSDGGAITNIFSAEAQSFRSLRTELAELPSAPAITAGYGKLWAKDDGTLHYINDASVDIELGPGGGTGNVVGPASSTNEAIARWDTETGELLQDSPATLTDSGVLSTSTVSTTNTVALRLDVVETLSAPTLQPGIGKLWTRISDKTLHYLNSAGADITLGTGGGTGTVDSVVPGPGITVDATDPANPEVSFGPINYAQINAQVVDEGVAPRKHNTITEKNPPVSADTVLINDSAAGGALKKVQIGNLPGGIDSTAVHTNTANEFASASGGLKAAPVGADRVLIEDSAGATYGKKYITISGIDHGALANMGADVHQHYALATGARAFTGPIEIAGASSAITVGEHATAPATPATGKVAIYAKADGMVYSKDDAGLEKNLTAGNNSAIGQWEFVYTSGDPSAQHMSKNAQSLKNSAGNNFQIADVSQIPQINVSTVLSKISVGDSLIFQNVANPMDAAVYTVTSSSQIGSYRDIGVTFVGSSGSSAFIGTYSLQRVPAVSGGHTIQDNGTPLTQRGNLNFVGFTVADDSGNNRTVVTAPASTGSATNKSGTILAPEAATPYVLFRTVGAIDWNQVDILVKGTSPNIDWTIYYSDAADVGNTGGASTVSIATADGTTSTAQNTTTGTIPANKWVWLRVDVINSGTVDFVSVAIDHDAVGATGGLPKSYFTRVAADFTQSSTYVAFTNLTLTPSATGSPWYLVTATVPVTTINTTATHTVDIGLHINGALVTGCEARWLRASTTANATDVLVLQHKAQQTSSVPWAVYWKTSDATGGASGVNQATLSIVEVAA